MLRRLFIFTAMLILILNIATAIEGYYTDDDKRDVSENPKGYLNLLDYFEYEPEDYDQGRCGNCWAWGSTVAIQLALNFEEGIRDRISIQYINSGMNGDLIEREGWFACKGGLEYFTATYYNHVGKIIPESNRGADYADYYPRYDDRSNRDISDIYTDIYYPVKDVDFEIIDRETNTNEEIKNIIKEKLKDGKAVAYGYYLPVELGAWNEFYKFWKDEPNNLWNPKDYEDLTWERVGGHMVAIIGYDETVPGEEHWIVLNSWGPYEGRPNGLFKLDMDSDFKAKFYYPEGDYGYMHRLTYLDNIEFGDEDGIKISPQRHDSVRMSNMRFEADRQHETIQTSIRLTSNEDYMNLLDVKVTYVIYDLGIKRTMGPFDIDMDDEVVKKINMDLPRDTPPGEYDVRITLTNEDGLKRVKHRIIMVD